MLSKNVSIVRISAANVRDTVHWNSFIKEIVIVKLIIFVRGSVKWNLHAKKKGIYVALNMVTQILTNVTKGLMLVANLANLAN